MHQVLVCGRPSVFDKVSLRLQEMSEPNVRACNACGMSLGPSVALYHLFTPGLGPMCAACVAVDPFLEEPDWQSRSRKPLLPAKIPGPSVHALHADAHARVTARIAPMQMMSTIAGQRPPQVGACLHGNDIQYIRLPGVWMNDGFHAVICI